MAKFHKTGEHDILVFQLRKAREAAGLSQSELSRRLGHHVNYINRVELGRHSVDVINLLRILEAMGVEPRSFLTSLVDEIEK